MLKFVSVSSFFLLLNLLSTIFLFYFISFYKHFSSYAHILFYWALSHNWNSKTLLTQFVKKCLYFCGILCARDCTLLLYDASECEAIEGLSSNVCLREHIIHTAYASAVYTMEKRERLMMMKKLLYIRQHKLSSGGASKIFIKNCVL